MQKFCAFDIEILKEIPQGEGWRLHRPLGITCAATQRTDDLSPLVWHPDLTNPVAMDKVACIKMVEYLLEQHQQGFIPLTWNGDFDFDVLAEESGMLEECSFLALKSVDMMFHIFCIKGFRLGLQAASIGMGLKGKTEGMHGDLAPVMWQQTKEDREKVCEYVGGDAKATLDLANACIPRGFLKWISKSGRLNSVNLARNNFEYEWFTVEKAFNLPLPDQSWMDKPIPRTDFYNWVNWKEGSK